MKYKEDKSLKLLVILFLKFSDITKIQNGIGDKIGSLQQAIAMLVAGMAIGFGYGWQLTLVIMAMSPLLIFAAYITGKVSVIHLHHLSKDSGRCNIPCWHACLNTSLKKTDVCGQLSRVTHKDLCKRASVNIGLMLKRLSKE